MAHRVPKGTPIVMPNLAMNRDKALWGEDAFEFRCVSFCSIGQPYSHLLQPRSLGGSPRCCHSHSGNMGEQSHLHGRAACLSRFPILIESVPHLFYFRIIQSLTICRIKVAVFTLLRSFEFQLAVPIEDIGKSTTLLVRPMMLSDPDKGPQLPMLVRPCRQD